MDYFDRFLWILLTFPAFKMDVGRVNGQCQDWNLQRLNEDSPIYFVNSSVSNRFILSCWVWRDSRSGGTWDSRIRIGLDRNDSRGGGFNYKNSLGRETMNLRWVVSSGGNVTWQASTDTYFPISSWNLTAVGTSWGYSTSSDGRWYFHLDNKTIEPSTMPVTNVLLVPRRWRRSNDLKKIKHSGIVASNGHSSRQEGSGTTELFETVSAIFSTVLSSLASTLANVLNLDFLLGGGMDSDDGGDVRPTPDPDSEPITTTTAKGNLNNNVINKLRKSL